MTTDSMTLSNDSSALSLRDGVKALQSQRVDAETQIQVQENAQKEINTNTNLAAQTAKEVEEPAIEDESELEAEAETEDETESDEQEEYTEDEAEEELIVEAPEEPQGLLTLEDGTTLSVDEAKNGYLRNRDYTQKTQKLSEQRKELEAEAKSRLQTLDLAISASRPEQEPNWRQRAKSNPNNWQLEKLDYEERARARNNAIAILKQEQNNIIEKTKETAVHDLQSGVYRNEWKNTDSFVADINKTNDFAIKKLGFSEQELGGIGDPRAIIALDMARRFAETKTKVQAANKKVVNKPKPLRGGKKTSLKAGKSRGVSTAQKQFNDNPTRANALALMKAQRTNKS
tara:strand:+ start:784 stop:1815 length:1032 start_codon:yes stop_codon:yes gene_type:complete